MNHAKNFLRSRLSRLLALIAFFGMALAGLRQPAAFAVCPDAAYVAYYSDATYTTVVGTCTHACCHVWTCTGTLTQYSKVLNEVSCDFN
ncbi:MAG TPA: hypothetical protein VIE43_17935 [Thermoanaerobaculia bacterium]|nr:hypothetical protein [Thermoanaerobaculia bacterium]